MLYLDSRPVVRDGHALGDVLIVRDRTDLVALTERLETVRTMTAALRVQRHEFANRMHVAAGLIDADRVPQARARSVHPPTPMRVCAPASPAALCGARVSR